MQTMHKSVYFMLCLLQFVDVYKFPQLCVNNSNFSSCTRRALEALRPYLMKGIPELDLPPIDPLRVTNLKGVRTDSHIAYYNVTVTYMLWVGGKNFQIFDIFVNPNEFTFRLKLGFPYLHVEVSEFVDGKLLSFYFKGPGVFCANYTNVVVDIVLNGQGYSSKGSEYIKWKKEDIRISFDGSFLTHLSGFFEDTLYTEFLRVSINKAARILVVPFRSVIEVGLGDFIIEMANRVHSRFPKNILYPTS